MRSYVLLAALITACFITSAKTARADIAPEKVKIITLLIFYTEESNTFDLMIADRLALIREKAKADGHELPLTVVDNYDYLFKRQKRAYLQRVMDAYDREFDVEQLSTLSTFLAGKGTRSICKALTDLAWEHPAIPADAIPTKMELKFGETAWRIYQQNLEDETFGRYAGHFSDVLRKFRAEYMAAEIRRVVEPDTVTP